MLLAGDVSLKHSPEIVMTSGEQQVEYSFYLKTNRKQQII